MKATASPLTSALLKFSAFAAVLVPAVAHAGYVNNRAQWLGLTPEARAGYAQGMADSLNYIFNDDSLAAALLKRARNKCLADQKTTAAILADRITTGYNDQRLTGIAPTAMFFLKMNEVCKPDINRERAAFGLPPLP